MRIAYVCADAGIPVFGCKGAANHVREVVRAFRRRAARVTIMAARTGGAPPCDLADVELRRIPIPQYGDAEDRARTALATNRVTRRLVAEAGPFDLVYERHALWSWAAMRHASATGTASVLEVNAPLVEEQARARVLPMREVAERAAKRAFTNAGALIAVSPAVAAHLEGFAEARGRVHVVPNGVDAHRFAPPKRPVQPFTVGFVGTLRPWHDLATLVGAFALLLQTVPSARLMIVGDGPGRSALAADLAARGLTDRAILTGAVAADEVPGLMRRMSVGVAPYSATQPFYFSPLKLYEYMAASLPVVASQIGHLPEVVRNGTDGLLYQPDDPGGLAAALQVLALDPAYAARLGESGRARAVADHSWDAVVARILGLAGVESREAAA